VVSIVSLLQSLAYLLNEASDGFIPIHHIPAIMYMLHFVFCFIFEHLKLVYGLLLVLEF